MAFGQPPLPAPKAKPAAKGKIGKPKKTPAQAIQPPAALPGAKQFAANLEHPSLMRSRRGVHAGFQKAAKGLGFGTGARVKGM